MRCVIAWAILAVAFAIADALLDSVEISGGVFTLLWVALLFAVVSVILRPILRLVSMPLNVVTLGLFSLVINGIILAVVAWLSDSLQVGRFVNTIVAAIIISLVTLLLNALVPDHLGADS
jgi:putative membrane protein